MTPPPRPSVVPSPRPARSRLPAAWAATLWSILVLAAVPRASTADEPLADEARRAIVAEAQTDFARAMELRATDPERATAGFRRAAEKFELVIADGDASGDLRYDAGNARVRAGDLGLGIAHLLEARRRLGAADDVTANLGAARRLAAVRGADAFPPTLDRRVLAWLLGWHERWTLPTRFAIFAGAWSGFWACLVLVIRDARRGRPRRPLRLATFAFLAAWVVVGGSVGGDLVDLDGTHGVVRVDRATLRSGNDESFESAADAELVDGTEFDVLEVRGDWLEIELADGTRGWLPASAVVLVGGA